MNITLKQIAVGTSLLAAMSFAYAGGDSKAKTSDSTYSGSSVRTAADMDNMDKDRSTDATKRSMNKDRNMSKKDMGKKGQNDPNRGDSGKTAAQTGSSPIHKGNTPETPN